MAGDIQNRRRRGAALRGRSYSFVRHGPRVFAHAAGRQLAHQGDMLVEPSGPGQEGWITHTFRLERMDGTPADPPSFKTTLLVWAPGDQIPLGTKTLQVFRLRHDDAGELPELVVGDLA